MFLNLVLFVLAITFAFSSSDRLPTSYEYYTTDGISSGLSADQSYFTLNGKNFTIYSGALHYFRVPRGHWRDRLKKIRAAGLNTVESYVPWNLHEPFSDVYDFGDGGSEMEDFVHIQEFLTTAQEEDLFVILRPGPYICAEYNYGGFPSWLLREGVGFRTAEENYVKFFTRYYNILLPILAEYQFTKGGPIIAFQLENEYGFSKSDVFTPQIEYVEELYDVFIQNEIVELLVTSDPPFIGINGTLPGRVLHTMNFGDNPKSNLDLLESLQPDRPVMVMEYWMGWYDFWGSDEHQTKDIATVIEPYEIILNYPASVNIYTFVGSTNFGFTNGAALGNDYVNAGFLPVTTSYDYDSPISEAGDLTEKYYRVRELLETYSTVKTYTPDVPELIPRIAYPSITIEQQLTFDDVMKYNAPYVIESEKPIAMELLEINNSSGQSVGYIVYRIENVDLEEDTVLTIEGHVCDTVFVLVDGVLVSPILKTVDDFDGFGYWRLENSSLVINSEEKSGATIDLIVEEWGRMDGGNILQYNKSFKGLWQGDVYLNEQKVNSYKITPLEFTKKWNNNLTGWTEKTSDDGPSLYLATLELDEEPTDTYLDLSDWTRGLVIVNGFPLGKYALIGPQQTLYLPGPFLKKGSNDIIIFEHFKAADELKFSTDPIWT